LRGKRGVGESRMDDAGDGNEVERVAAMVDLKRVWAKIVEREYVKCRA
jgi:hypothetical protein